MIVQARLIKRRTEDGLVEMKDSVPIGKLYEADLSRVYRGMPMRHENGTLHTKDVVWVKNPDGTWGWFALELLQLKVPRGFTVTEKEGD